MFYRWMMIYLEESISVFLQHDWWLSFHLYLSPLRRVATTTVVGWVSRTETTTIKTTTTSHTHQLQLQLHTINLLWAPPTPPLPMMMLTWQFVVALRFGLKPQGLARRLAKLQQAICLCVLPLTTCQDELRCSSSSSVGSILSLPEVKSTQTVSASFPF